MEAVIEKECSALGGLFQTTISDMKGSYPIWEDFINKAGKLQSQLSFQDHEILGNVFGIGLSLPSSWNYNGVIDLKSPTDWLCA